MPDWGRCGLCHIMKNVAYSSVVDADICSACYRRELQPREPCSRCGNVAAIRARPDGVSGYCNRCYLAELHVGRCFVCRVRKPIAIRDRGRPVCPGCYRRQFAAREACATCRTRSVVAARNTRGEAVCPNCYGNRMRPRERCTRCNERQIVQTRTAEGKPICATCYRTTMQLARCGHCGNLSRVMTRSTSGKPVCATCYSRHDYGPKETCAICSAFRQVKRRLPSGRGACSACYQRELRPGALRAR